MTRNRLWLLVCIAVVLLVSALRRRQNPLLRPTPPATRYRLFSPLLLRSPAPLRFRPLLQ